MATSQTPMSANRKHVLCRLARSPFVLFGVAFTYFVYVIVFQDGAHSVGSRSQDALALRGSSPEPTEEVDEYIEEDALWEPQEQGEGDGSHVVHAANSGGVKGGVEVYPLQPGRRPRAAAVPTVPHADELEGVFTTWAFPDVYEDGGGRSLKGLYVLFHGCTHGAMDWFNLPEERAIVEHLLKQQYAVVAPSSGNRQSGCWTIGKGGNDVEAVRAVLWRFYRDWSIPPETPLFLFGASSGGTMATAMGSQGGFQLCEKVSTYVKVSGILSQVSWGIDPVNFGPGCPPIGFMTMAKGESPVEAKVPGRRGTPPVFGASANIPPQMVSIAHMVRKKGGRPRMLHLPLGELDMYSAFFSDRVYEVTEEESKALYAAMIAAHVLECSPNAIIEAEPKCRLEKDPRHHPLALDTILSTYQIVLKNDAAERSQLPSGQARPVFEELLNVAWGAHELSAEFAPLWEKWLWGSCGDTCQIWRGGAIARLDNGDRTRS